MTRYYFRHLRRTVAKKPTQPLLVTVIFLLSFLILTVGISSSRAIGKEERARTNGAYGTADLTVSTSSTSPSRFLFASDVYALLPDARVTGSFTMPYLSGDQLVSGYAVPFDTVGDLFDLTFSEYMPFDRGERASVALVSRAFANKYHVALGDEVSFSVFGKDVTYRVTGISELPFLGTADVLTDLSGAVNALIGENALTPLMGESFAPCATLYVRLSDGASSPDDVRSAMDALGAQFPHDRVSTVDHESSTTLYESMRIITFVLVFLVIVSAFAVLFCCVYCMAKERAQDAELFALCGASHRRMRRLQIAELALYAFVGCALGTLLSIPIGTYTYRAIGFSYIRYHLDPLALTVAVLIVFAIAIVTPIVFSSRANTAKRTVKVPRFLRFVLPAVTAVTLPVSFTQTGICRFAFAFVGLGAIFASIALFVGDLYRSVALALAKRTKNVPARIGRKNAARVRALSNTACLCWILLTVLAIAFFCIGISNRFIAEVYRWVDAEYSVTGGTARVAEPLANLEEADGVYGYMIVDARVHGKNAHVWFVGDTSFLGETCGTSSVPAPKGNRVILSETYASKFDLRSGDTAVIEYNGGSYEVVVDATVSSNIAFFLADAEWFGISYPSYFVKAKEGVAPDELYRAITKALAAETVAVVPVSTTLSSIVEANNVYLYFERILVCFLAVFALVGTADNLAESLRSRKEEFALFRVAGMSRRDVSKMLRAETLYTVLFVLCGALVTSAVAVVAAHSGIFAFGTNSLRLYFR